jgi:hypothetical protein
MNQAPTIASDAGTQFTPFREAKLLARLPIAEYNRVRERNHRLASGLARARCSVVYFRFGLVQGCS